MKYQIIVEKLPDSSCVAFCPVMGHFTATGDSVTSALARLRQDFCCYLHDPDAEFEITTGSKGQKTGEDGLPFGKDFLSSGG